MAKRSGLTLWLSCRSCFQMSAVGITENAKGDNKKFEIWCNSRDEVFIVQVSTLNRTAFTLL